MSIARTLVVALSVAASLTGGVWAGASVARTIVTTPDLLVGRALEHDSLHRLGLRALELDIANSDYIAGVNRSPLDVTLDDVSRVLHNTYTPPETAAKAQEVQLALLRFIDRYPADSIFRISIATERPVLSDSLGRILLAKYASMPDCGFGDDVSTLLSAADVRLFGGSGDEFFYEEHPDCRPPDVVATRVEDGIREALTRTAETGPDSLEVFPEEPDDPGFAQAMVTAGRGLTWTEWRWPFLALLLAAIGHAWTAGVGGAWRLALGAGVGLAAYGAAVLAWAPARIRSGMAGAGTVGEASEVWASLGIYGFQRVAQLSGSWAMMAGGGLVAAALLLRLLLSRPRRGS